MGILTPDTIKCTEAIAAAKKTREIEYLGEVEFVSSNQDVAGILSGFSKINEKFGRRKLGTADSALNSGSYHQHIYGEGKSCGIPKKDGDQLTYK